MHKAQKTKKGYTMNTSNDNIKTNEQNKFPYISRHFAERYYERILDAPKPIIFNKAVYNNIKRDMIKRMLDREKAILKLFAKSPQAVVPISRFNQMVVSNNTLVTIY
jgi:putative cell wall-binding protein